MNNKHPGKIKVCICLGSSCFSRGSKEALKVLQEYVKNNNLDDIVDISGSLCEGNCQDGPNVIINNERHKGITPGVLIDLVKYYVNKDDKASG